MNERYFARCAEQKTLLEPAASCCRVSRACGILLPHKKKREPVCTGSREGRIKIVLVHCPGLGVRTVARVGQHGRAVRIPRPSDVETQPGVGVLESYAATDGRGRP